MSDTPDEPFEFDREALLRTFFAEADEGLQSLEKAALELESGDREATKALFRALHTLKGNSLSLGYPQLAGYAHALEDRLDPLRKGTLRPDPSLVSLLLGAVDALRELLGDAQAGAELEVLRPRHQALLEKLGRIRSSEAEALPAGESEPQGGDALLGPRTLRVDTARLDRMFDLAGEVAVARGQLRARLESRALAPAARLRAALDSLDDLDQLSAELQEQIVKVRAVPIGPTLRQHLRTVRDAAASTGRQARLVVADHGVELDTSVVELLRDPLTHLVRNAVAHGLETPEQRLAAGKEPTGVVTLRARHDGNHVVVEVGDDGRGFDRGKIAAKARALGILSDGEQLSDDALFEVVFQPGFTTSDTVSDLAGRGVGMDVVRYNVQRLRGSVSIDSSPGKGATISLRLPLTLAILEAFFVDVAGDSWAIPLEQVEECLDLPALPCDASGVVDLRGQPLPCLRLRQRLGIPGDPPAREALVVVQHGRGRAGLVVDRLLGARQTVLRPLSPVLQAARCVGGSAVLGDGRIALFLDVPALLEGAGRSPPA